MSHIHSTTGYLVTSIQHGRKIGNHQIIAERALGRKLPEGAVVHHHDRNKLNNANTNLVICEDSAYHQYLHGRMRTLAAGFDPNEFRWCSDESRYIPKYEFGSDTNKYDGLSKRCRKCNRAKCRDYYQRHIDTRKAWQNAYYQRVKNFKALA